MRALQVMTIQRRVYTLGRCLPTEHLDCSIITARLLGMMVFLLGLSLFTRRQAFMHAGGRRLFLIQWISMTEKGERKMQQTWGSIRIPWKRTPHKQFVAEPWTRVSFAFGSEMTCRPWDEIRKLHLFSNSPSPIFPLYSLKRMWWKSKTTAHQV